VAEEQRLQRQVTLRQTLYLSLAQNYESAKIEEVRNTPVITLVERPEGFVEPRPRRTVVKALAALLLAGFAGVAASFTIEVVRLARSSGLAEFEEFLASWRALVAWARTLTRRRSA
jgi:uncharacterized protein involved in exopolysaccharide biosynthesis